MFATSSSRVSRLVGGIVVLTVVVLAQEDTKPCVFEPTYRVDNVSGEVINSSQLSRPGPSPLAHPCQRDCSNSEGPMTCHYSFNVEWYYGMSKAACLNCPCNQNDCNRPGCVALNGVPRPVTVANRALPGPSIEVCLNDTIVIDVTNSLQNGEGISIHSHGLHQRGTQYMDGVSLLTQCHITPYTSFRYDFTAGNPGTHFWHAHTGTHRMDGLFGKFIIRQADEDNVHIDLYDFDLPEHTMIVHDWLRYPSVSAFTAENFGDANVGPRSVLFNGKGQMGAYRNTSSDSEHFTPREVFTVEKGSRYRFRVVSNALTDSPLKISVDDHNLTLIATDGRDIEPLEVDAFVIYAGERYDFVLTASEAEGNYWMRAKGYGEGRDIQGLAIIRYEGASDEDPTNVPDDDRMGVVLQAWNEFPSADVITTNQMRAIENANLPQEKKHTVYLPVRTSNINDPYGNNELVQVNYRSLKIGPAPPLTQLSDIPEEQICEADNNTETCEKEYCECTQIITVELGQTLEVIFVDVGSAFQSNHPFHLHGYAFNVVGQGKFNDTPTVEEIKRMDAAGNLPRNIDDHPPRKDTVIVPNNGYTIIQFVADNPGWWFFHCHIEFHALVGMGVFVHVGEQSDLPPVPEDFPQCGNWPRDSSTLTHRSSATAPGDFLSIVMIITAAAGLVILG